MPQVNPKDLFEFAKNARLTLEIRKGRLGFWHCSLKNLAKLSVLDNMKYFMDPRSDPFSFISIPMKNELIDFYNKISDSCLEVTDIIDASEGLQCQMLEKLLNPKMTLLQFPRVTRDSVEITALWKKLVEVNPPGLEKLTRKCRSDTNTWNLRPFFSSLLQFKSLKHLEIENFELCGADLSAIAANLIELRVLDVSLANTECVCREGFAALSQLQHLQKFYFNVVFNPDLKIALIVSCLSLMPHLMEIGSYPWTYNLNKQSQSTACCVLDSIAFNIALDELAANQAAGDHLELGLRKLYIGLHAVIPSTVRLPNLEKLLLLDPAADVQLTRDRFSKLTDLTLSRLHNMDQCIYILNNVGRQLTGLGVAMKGALDVSRLLELAPKLSTLSMSAWEFVASSELNPATLLRLRELNMEEVEQTVYVGLCIEKGLMRQLLRSPKLRKVKLYSYFYEAFLDGQGLLDIVQDVKEKGTLRRLQTFEIVCSEVVNHFKGDARDLIALCNLVMNCPRLVSVGDIWGDLQI